VHLLYIGDDRTSQGSAADAPQLGAQSAEYHLHESGRGAGRRRRGPWHHDPVAPVSLAATPLFHVTSCNCSLHPITLAAGTLVLMYKWDPARALELIERERVATVACVPTMSRELLAHPDWVRRDTTSLTRLGGGGAHAEQDLVDEIVDLLPQGAPTTGYGLTETSGIVSATYGRTYLTKPGSCGAIVPTLEAKLVDELGNELTADPQTVGELCVRGAVVANGYLNDREVTAEVVRDGWFHTGVLARIDDDGDLFIVDRIKDVVIRGGENVYCAEVEAAIRGLAAVREVAVFGMADERLGERVAAVVVSQPGQVLDEPAVRDFVAARLARFKGARSRLDPNRAAAAERLRSRNYVRST
jgi:long-chain acyl-CoA synthetase